MFRLGLFSLGISVFLFCSASPSWALRQKTCQHGVAQHRYLSEEEKKLVPTEPIFYIDSDDFRHRQANDRFVTKAEAPPYVANDKDRKDLYLDRSQEVEWFARMNYYKFRAEKLRQQLLKGKPPRRLYDEFLFFTVSALNIRQFLQSLNQGLIGMAGKKFETLTLSLDDLVSEGQAKLIDAIERYDFRLGWRFSTFASSCLFRHFIRVREVHDKRQAHERQVAGWEREEGNPISRAQATSGSEREDDQRAQYFSSAVSSLMDSITNPRDRTILILRFGLFGEVPHTLKEVGARLGISKERVRQIESQLLQALALRASELGLNPEADSLP